MTRLTQGAAAVCGIEQAASSSRQQQQPARKKPVSAAETRAQRAQARVEKQESGAGVLTLSGKHAEQRKSMAAAAGAAAAAAAAAAADASGKSTSCTNSRDVSPPPLGAATAGAAGAVGGEGDKPKREEPEEIVHAEGEAGRGRQVSSEEAAEAGKGQWGRLKGSRDRELVLTAPRSRKRRREDFGDDAYEVWGLGFRV
jgi:hypothetical protein